MTFTPTAEQRAIIEYPALPLRVAAGAGTGKTTTIVYRLAALVRAGLRPERAIGITFTNKAAEELAAKLRDVLPDLAEEGREVEVTTYHGFAYGILQEFGAFIGVERDSDVIGAGHVRQLMQDAIAGGTFPHLDLTAVAQRVDEAVDLGSQLSRNLCSPDAVAQLPAEDTLALRRADLASVIDRYTALKRDLGVLDYGDLILLTHQMLTSHPDLARRIRARYSVALLDEYQDTDPAQRELLRLIFGDGFPVTAVGDADQTIYEWRGASTENFESFPTHFPAGDGRPAATLPLTENRRSHAAILDVAHAIRSGLHGDGTFDKLRPVAGTPQGAVSADFFRTAVDEAESIAEEIVRLHDEEAVRWKDVAVIFRKNMDMALVRDALQEQQVPVEVGSLGGLLDLPDVADLHAWLRTIAWPGDSIALARLLLGPRYRLGLRDIGALTDWVKPNRTQLGDDPDLGWPLVEAIDQLEEISGLRPKARSRLASFRTLYRQFLNYGQGASLVDLCRHILDETGMWNEIEARDRGSALTARVNLYRFLDLAEEWSPLRGRPTLEAFLGYLELIADDSSSAELDTANVGAEDAVVLLTIHRAKGLEWDTVFLPALTTGVFPAASSALDDPAQLARFVPYELRLEPPIPIELEGEDRRNALRRFHERQEWRAAYVGVTRARSRLYVSGSFWHGSAKRPRSPSPLLEAATTVPDLEIVMRADAPGERPDSLSVVSNVGAPDPLFPDGWRSALRRSLADPDLPATLGEGASYDAAVKQIRLTLDDMPAPPPAAAEPPRVDTSVTGLVALAQCPQRFYWSEIDPLPRRPAAAMRRGVKVHRLIELHGRGQMPLEELDDVLYDLPEGDRRAHSGPDPYQVYLDSRFAAMRPRFIEAPIDVRLSSGRVRGRIDAIYENEDRRWEIVDFKSGRRKENASAVVQLEAYAVAAAEGGLSPEPPAAITVTFAYLGGGSLEEELHDVDTAWIDDARTHLTDLVTAAAGPDYPQVPSPACQTCDFLRFCEIGRAHVVTGPALRSLTSIIAPNSPVATATPWSLIKPTT